MSNITQFYRIEDERRKYIFMNKPVMIHRSEDVVQFPCVGLYHREAIDTPVWYPLYERWYLPLNKAQNMAATTLRKRSTAVCYFLNYFLWNTTHAHLYQITLNDIRDFLAAYKTKENGQQRSAQGWQEGVAFVYDFLAAYYAHNKDNFPFAYQYQDLITERIVRDSKLKRKTVIKDYNYMSVRAPKQTTKKNRFLLYGYLDFILFECKMYDPELTLAVALQAYAGLREGEVVNLTYDRINLKAAGFGRIGSISFDLTKPASFANDGRKSEFGNIKIPRKQMVYPDFNERIMELYEAHAARHHAMGLPTTGDAPVFVNTYKKPMSNSTYTGHVKKLFCEHFLPDLKKASEEKGTWVVDAPYIEAYENDYPGAHAFRHWFTMYLFQRANLRSDEISKWRGDSNRESMLDYIHVNADMLKAYGAAVHTFQEAWLREIL